MKSVSRTLYVLMYMSWTFLPLSCVLLQILKGVGLGLVERTFLRVWFMWPLGVSVVSG